MFVLFVCAITTVAFLAIFYAVGSAKPTEPARRQTVAKRRFIALRLSDIKLDPKRLSHRSDLSDESIDELYRSIVEEGQLVPPTVWKDPKTGTWFAVAGTRRLLAHQKAVGDNVDRTIFHEDMELLCVEIYDSDEVDLQLVSVADNTHRRDFTISERIAIAGQWSLQKMPINRCASALRISETQYRRWVLIADNPWMVNLINDDCVEPSFAARILELAKSKGRLAELQQDIEDWVAETRLRIKRFAQRLADAHKKMPDAEQKFRHYLTKKIQDRWIECVTEGLRLNDEVSLRFGVHFDPEKRTLTIPPLEADSKTNPTDLLKVLEELAEAPLKVAQFIKQLRIDRELRAGASVAGLSNKLGLLDSLGLGDLAREVEQTRQQREADESGDDDPSYEHRVHRDDHDLATDIERAPSDEQNTERD